MMKILVAVLALLIGVTGCSPLGKEEPMCFDTCQCQKGCAVLHEPFFHYRSERVTFGPDVEDCWCIKDGAPHKIW